MNLQQRERAQTLFEKIWSRHVVAQQEDGAALLYIDHNFIHEGPFYAFDGLRRERRTVRRPLKHTAFSDHYLPTLNREQGLRAVTDREGREVIERLDLNCREFGIPFIGIDDRRQGIMHVVGPELGLVQPGMVITGSDSHTTTHGAFGAFSFGIGASEVKHVLATQMSWQRQPRTLRVTVSGRLPDGVSAKDVILLILSKLGVRGGAGQVIEYAGSAICEMSIEQRMTICNMTIELGARSGIIAPDEKTFSYLEGREFAPKGGAWGDAIALWRSLYSDPDARFDREFELSISEMAPMVTWGTAPDDALPITGAVPHPKEAKSDEHHAHIERTLAYMNLRPGQRLEDIAIDRVFIGSCTNARLEDLRAAADVVVGRQVKVPSIISPGSTAVKRQAEAEGLHRVFVDAGFDWRDSACSMCVGENGDTVSAGERCVSTSSRNFENRQGRGARTHLASAQMAAAAAVTGRLCDVRALIR